MDRIYLDYNASTPVAPEVVEAMRPFLTDHFGNPSSQHWAGRPAKEAIERSRSDVAGLVGCEPAEIVFTSGGTEANNLALKGNYFRAPSPFHLIISAIEHPAILAPSRFLERLGARVSVVGVDATGRVDPDDVRRAMAPDTRLVSIMHANNEVGTIEPIAAIAKIAREHGCLMHTDAAQSVGKIGTNVDELGVDLLSIAGHKLYAPKGVGALYVRRGVELEPLLHGAGHESGRRAGTESALLAVALGAACRRARAWAGSDALRDLRDYFWDRMREKLGLKVSLNGHPTERLPNTLNVSFRGVLAAELLSRIPRLAASTGSACHSGAVFLSPVLAAMGIAPQAGQGAVRFSLGRGTTRAELDTVVDLLLTHLDS